MSQVDFHKPFSPAEATRGKFVPVKTDTLQDYPPTGSRGRYAQLAYIIGSEPGAMNLALSGSTVILPVSTVTIDEPVTIEQPIDVKKIIDPVTLTQPISVHSIEEPVTLVQPISVHSIEEPVTLVQPVEVKNETNGVLDVNQQPLNASDYQSLTISATSKRTATFTSAIDLLEVFNNSTDGIEIYLSFSDKTLTWIATNGMVIPAQTFYSIERNVTEIYIGNNNDSNPVDVRVVGHYRA